MPQTHGLGRFFWHGIRLKPGSALHHRHATHEIEHPYRTALSHVLRLPTSQWALVVGRWSKEGRDEELALLEAIEGRVERGDIVGEGGTSVQEHVAAAYERRLRKMNKFLRDTEELDRPDNGWTVL